MLLFADGLMHPLSGLDHICAMLVVGLTAYTLMPSRPVAAPVLFLPGLRAARLRRGSVSFCPFFEQGIMLSLVVLGALAAFGLAAPAALGGALLLVFGAAHGAAHGAEAPAASFVAYMGGFMIASALLHGAGLGLAALARRHGKGVFVRAAGGLTALLGLALLVGMGA